MKIEKDQFKINGGSVSWETGDGGEAYVSAPKRTSVICQLFVSVGVDSDLCVGNSCTNCSIIRLLLKNYNRKNVETALQIIIDTTKRS